MAELDEACREMLTSCACEALRRSSRAVTAFYEEGMLGSGVRATQLPLLVAAQLAGPAPIGDLAAALVMDRTTLTRNLKALQDRGFVTVRPDRDKRVRLVTLTADGREALTAAISQWREIHVTVTDGFGAERIQELVAELADLTQAVCEPE